MAINKQTLGAAIGIIGAGGDSGIAGRVTAIENKIPAEASSTNKLADKAYVNDAIENNIGSAVSDWLDEHVDPATGYVVDNTLSISGAAADAAACGELKSAVTNNAISALLHAEEIENTVQSILFDESGNVQSITHARDNVAIRTDEFTFADGTITETRTLNTGESMTIVTNTNTLQTTITYTAA